MTKSNDSRHTYILLHMYVRTYVQRNIKSQLLCISASAAGTSAIPRT